MRSLNIHCPWSSNVNVFYVYMYIHLCIAGVRNLASLYQSEWCRHLSGECTGRAGSTEKKLPSAEESVLCWTFAGTQRLSSVHRSPSKTTCTVYLESFCLCYFFIINHIQHPLHAECHLNHGPLVYIVLTLNTLMATIVVFNPFYLPIKSLLLGTKCVFKHQDLQMFDL